MSVSILVVDDDPLFADLVVLHLERQGWQTRVALDGRQGLDAARAERPDLVLTDWALPKLDGVHLCKVARADPDLRDVPLILMSAVLDTETLEVCRAFDIDGVWEKSGHVDELVGEVKRVLGRFAARRALSVPTSGS